MPDLGKKYDCFNCHTKFYNLGKPEAICPKCGANQKNAKLQGDLEKALKLLKEFRSKRPS